jgi:hypothetical protein
MACRRINVADQLYYIASLKHTNKEHEHITFWGPDYRGYVLAITDERVGRYSADFIAQDGGRLNDGECCIAVPEEVVKSLLSPTPYYANGKGVAQQFYDIAGPVVDNTRANWNRLIAASMADHRRFKPKPEVFRRKRRSFALEAVSGVSVPGHQTFSQKPRCPASLPVAEHSTLFRA